MLKDFLKEWKQFNIFQKIFLVLACLAILAYGLIHGGLVKLPAAKAYDCSKINNSKQVSIIMKNGQFDPQNAKVQVCDTLLFINQDNIGRWPAVGPHPTHSSYPGFDSERPLAQNQVFKFTVNRPGYYSIHDHLNPDMLGSVTIVTP